MSKSPKKNKTAKKKPKQEHLSFKDIEELMGVHKDVYTRKHGAIRRK